MKYLVTGSSGVVGGRVAKLLIGQGHDVVGVDREPGSWDEERPQAEYVRDLGSAGVAREIVENEGPDVVIHCAAIVNFPTLSRDPRYGFQVNVVSAVEFAEASRDSAVARFVFLSSRAVYGLQGNRPLTAVWESDALNPREWYDVYKVAAESLCQSILSPSRTELAVLRFSTIYGPGKGARHTTANAISRIVETAEGDVLRVEGRSDEPLDLVYVEDVSRAVVQCATSTERFDDATFNIGSGRIVTLGDLVEALREVAPEAKVELTEAADALVPRYRLPLAIDAAQTGFGFVPEFDLVRGVRHYRESMTLA